MLVSSSLVGEIGGRQWHGPGQLGGGCYPRPADRAAEDPIGHGAPAVPHGPGRGVWPRGRLEGPGRPATPASRSAPGPEGGTGDAAPA